MRWLALMVAGVQAGYPAGKSLPKSVKAAYVQSQSQSVIDKAVRTGGVNVLMWSFLWYVDGVVGPVKYETLKKKDLEHAQTTHPDVVNFVAFGGWGHPHPTPLNDGSAEEFVKKFHTWNQDWGFDGFDWDIEGVNEIGSPDNDIEPKLLKWMCDVSIGLKAKGYLISIVPAQSYMDPSHSKFDVTGNTSHADDWKPSFSYHGHNSYAPLLLEDKCMPSSTYDIVILQVYEGFSRAHAEYENPMYFVNLLDMMLKGWEVDFKDLWGGVGKRTVKVQAGKLALGLGLTTKEWTEKDKDIVNAEDKFFRISADKLIYPCWIRGFAFWSLKWDKTADYSKRIPTECREDVKPDEPGKGNRPGNGNSCNKNTNKGNNKGECKNGKPVNPAGKEPNPDWLGDGTGNNNLPAAAGGSGSAGGAGASGGAEGAGSTKAGEGGLTNTHLALIGLAVLFFIALSGVAIFVLTKKNKEQPPPEPQSQPSNTHKPPKRPGTNQSSSTHTRRRNPSMSMRN